MDFSKAFQIGTDYKDHRQSLNWDTFQFAEVIFVDKTHPSNRPQLYQFSDHKLKLEEIQNPKSHFPVFSKDTFVLVGEILDIDKKKKHAFLTNKHIISYNHLVIACGAKPILSCQDEELVAALQALTDAMRVKPKIPDSFPCLKAPVRNLPYKKENREKTLLVHHQTGINKVAHPYLKTASQESPSYLDTHNTRFYEVQI